MSEALDSYLAEWRETDPRRATAWLFLRPGERGRFGALAALQREWLKPVHEAHEPQVAATRLGWWREELQRAADGEARHPLARALVDDGLLQRVPLPYWTAAVDATFPLLDANPPADFAGQRAAIAPWAAAAAALETRAWFGPDAEVARATEVIALAYLANSVRALPAEAAHGRSPLPMNLLARHGLSIGELGSDSPARRAAVRDQLTDLRRALVDAATMPGPLALFTDLDLRHDLRSLQSGIRAEDPLAALCAPGRGLGNLLQTWRAARIWRGIAGHQDDDER